MTDQSTPDEMTPEELAGLNAACDSTIPIGARLADAALAITPNNLAAMTALAFAMNMVIQFAFRNTSVEMQREIHKRFVDTVVIPTFDTIITAGTKPKGNA